MPIAYTETFYLSKTNTPIQWKLKAKLVNCVIYGCLCHLHAFYCAVFMCTHTKHSTSNCQRICDHFIQSIIKHSTSLVVARNNVESQLIWRILRKRKQTPYTHPKRYGDCFNSPVQIFKILIWKSLITSCNRFQLLAEKPLPSVLQKKKSCGIGNEKKKRVLIISCHTFCCARVYLIRS